MSGVIRCVWCSAKIRIGSFCSLQCAGEFRRLHMRNIESHQRAALSSTLPAHCRPQKCEQAPTPAAAHVMRRLNCDEYTRSCLTHAARSNWSGFNCHDCQHEGKIDRAQELADRRAAENFSLIISDMV